MVPTNRFTVILRTVYQRRSIEGNVRWVPLSDEDPRMIFRVAGASVAAQIRVPLCSFGGFRDVAPAGEGTLRSDAASSTGE